MILPVSRAGVAEHPEAERRAAIECHEALEGLARAALTEQDPVIQHSLHEPAAGVEVVYDVRRVDRLTQQRAGIDGAVGVGARRRSTKTTNSPSLVWEKASKRCGPAASPGSGESSSGATGSAHRGLRVAGEPGECRRGEAGAQGAERSGAAGRTTLVAGGGHQAQARGSRYVSTAEPDRLRRRCAVGHRIVARRPPVEHLQAAAVPVESDGGLEILDADQNLAEGYRLFLQSSPPTRISVRPERSLCSKRRCISGTCLSSATLVTGIFQRPDLRASWMPSFSAPPVAAMAT